MRLNVHLVDKDGQNVAGYDSQPHGGSLPTHAWMPGALVVDPIVMPIPSDLPLGHDYRLEIGLYEQPSMERLNVLGENNQFLSAPLVIAPLNVVAY